jgi:predicted outer membrane protein
MKALAAKKGLTLASAPRPDKAQMLADMNASKQGKDWDAAYLDAQIQDHKETIALFEGGEKNVQDADLKKLISTTLPKLRSHLKMVEDAKNKAK